jgi:transcriptional regulator with XRE-family HTH domain
MTISLATVVARNLRALKDHAEATQWRTKDGYPLWTIRGIEEASGISGSALSRFLRGERVPDVVQLEAIAKAYSLQPFDLLFSDIKPDAPPSERIETMRRFIASRMREEEKLLDDLRGVDGRPVSESSRRTGDDPHQVETGGKPPPKSPPHR